MFFKKGQQGTCWVYQQILGYRTLEKDFNLERTNTYNIDNALDFCTKILEDDRDFPYMKSDLEKLKKKKLTTKVVLPCNAEILVKNANE